MSKSNVGLSGERGPILLAIMVATGLAALDTTILSTAVPSVVKDLGNFAQFPWLFSIYLLAQSVTVPLYAKISDLFGRKPVLLLGIALFILGSIACSFSGSMLFLILSRGLQGLGAGAIMPMTITIAGDLYTVEERSRVQGYMASVWGISSVVGPALGGLFCQYLSWQGIFVLNIPLGLAAMVLLIKNFHETVHHRDHRLDWLGGALLTLGLSLLILALLEGGVSWTWNSVWSLGAFGLGALFIAVFLWTQTRVAEPILPLWVFTRPLLLTTSLISFGVGAILLGISSYLPTFLERALGLPPLVSGSVITALMIGWPLAASYSGRIYLRIGFRKTSLAGIGFLLLGGLLLYTQAAHPWLPLIIGTCLVMGVGFGLAATPIIVAAQASVDWNQRGVVTGTNQFARAVGSSVGIALFGALANSVLGHSGNTPSIQAVQGATGRVFLAILVVIGLTLVAGFFMPETDTHRPKPNEAQAGPQQVEA